MHKIVREIKLTKILGDDKLSSRTRKIKDFFEDVFNGLVQEVSEYNPHITYFYKTIDGKNHIYFKEDSKDEVMWCSQQYVWSFFETDFSYNDEQISELTYAMLEMQLNRKVFPTDYNLLNF